MNRLLRKSSFRILAVAAVIPSLKMKKSMSLMDASKEDHGVQHIVHQPSFGTTSTKSTIKKKHDINHITLDTLVLLSGSSHPELTKEISDLIKVPVADATLSRFSDGEISIRINDTIRGKDVYIIQPCSTPVNDSIMELLLTVSCARRAGARRIITVIPYFGYKHHRRGSSLSSKHHSRFLSSGATDFAKMLQEMGVDRVISIDLQRPGQGHEACFFDNNVPLETIITTELFIDHIVEKIPLREPIVVVTPNAECVKKARKYQSGLQKHFPNNEIKLAAFFTPSTSSGPVDTSKLELLGNQMVAGSDVIIVDDMVDTAGTLSSLSEKLNKLGANKIYLCASHGLFTEDSMRLIDKSHVSKVIVSNSIPIPKNSPQSSKVEQVSIAPLVANVIIAEHFGSEIIEIEEFEVDD